MAMLPKASKFQSLPETPIGGGVSAAIGVSSDLHYGMLPWRA